MMGWERRRMNGWRGGRGRRVWLLIIVNAALLVFAIGTRTCILCANIQKMKNLVGFFPVNLFFPFHLTLTPSLLLSLHAGITTDYYFAFVTFVIFFLAHFHYQ
jgi:hypothetical protein